MQIVYDGGRQAHLGSSEIFRRVRLIDRLNQGLSGDIVEISDQLAQTIAGWWQSPAKDNSTALSNYGVVCDDTELGDFCTPQDFNSATEDDKLCLRYLESYILSKQE
jgi:hypothetical protein